MEVRKRFENDKLKKLQIFNGAQLKYCLLYTSDAADE